MDATICRASRDTFGGPLSFKVIASPETFSQSFVEITSEDFSKKFFLPPGIEIEIGVEISKEKNRLYATFAGNGSKGIQKLITIVTGTVDTCDLCPKTPSPVKIWFHIADMKTKPYVGERPPEEYGWSDLIEYMGFIFDDCYLSMYPQWPQGVVEASSTGWVKFGLNFNVLGEVACYTGEGPFDPSDPLQINQRVVLAPAKNFT